MEISLADIDKTPVLSERTSSHSSTTSSSNSFMSDVVPAAAQQQQQQQHHPIIMTATTPQQGQKTTAPSGTELTPGSTLMSPFAPTHGMLDQSSHGVVPSYDWQHQHQQVQVQAQEQADQQQQQQQHQTHHHHHQQQTSAQQTTPQQSVTPVENKPNIHHDTPASYAGSDVTPSAAHKLPQIIGPCAEQPPPPPPPQSSYQHHHQPIAGPSDPSHQQQQHHQQQQQPPALTSRPFEFLRPTSESQTHQPQSQMTAYPAQPTFAPYQPPPQQHHQPLPPTGHPYPMPAGSYIMHQPPYPGMPGNGGGGGGGGGTSSTASMVGPTHTHHHHAPAPYTVTVAPPPGFSYSTHPSYPGYLVSADGMHHEGGGPPGVVFARSTDPRILRPKVKLTYEDKRRIVEIARSNTSLRQEDIAQQYGVDRSTISKILISAHRWSGPPQPNLAPAPPVSRAPRQVGGRFPAIEQRMHEWMDAQHAAGFEVRDNVARDKAREISRQMGFTDDRFKASAKWLDKFKERRKQLGLRGSVVSSFESDRPFLNSPDEGVPVVYSDQRPQHALPFTTTYQGFYQHLAPGTSSYSGNNSPASASMGMLSRSQSSATLASSDSSGIDAYPHSQMQSGRASTSIKSESDMMSLTTSTSDIAVSDALGHHSRNRSRSSPQPLPSSMSASQILEPASGRAPRFPATGGLVRQNSYHSGASPSPRRPTHSLHRSNSSGSSISLRRGTRPTSLAASAFGLTPMSQPSSHSADTSPHPSPGGSSQHHPQQQQQQQQQHSHVLPPPQGYVHASAPGQPGLGGGGGQMSLMAISPGTMSSAGTLSSSSSNNSIAASNGGHLPPLTPLSHQGPYAPNPYHQMQQHQLLEAPKYHETGTQQQAQQQLQQPQHHVQYYHPIQHQQHAEQEAPPPMHYAYAYAQPTHYGQPLAASNGQKATTQMQWSG